MKANHYFNIVKYSLVFIAVINLVLLFGFRYELPTSLKNKFMNRNQLEQSLYSNTSSEDSNTNTKLHFSFEAEAFQYDGSTALDLLSGVTLTDKKGNPVDLEIYSTIEATEDSNIKLVTYSARDDEGNEAIAERTLTLSNYQGPTLSIEQPYPEIMDVELGHILEKFLSNNLLSANDGYGKNITNAIQCNYKVSDAKARSVDITFTVTNHFDDTIRKTITTSISRTKPLILLNQTSLTLQKGDFFDPFAYVESATNEEGDDLKSLIEVSGDVNTSVSGSYIITYTLTDTDREQADPVTLKITVKE